MMSVVLKTVFGLLIACVLWQCLYVSYYSESRTFDKLITTGQENVSSGQAKVCKHETTVYSALLEIDVKYRQKT